MMNETSSYTIEEVAGLLKVSKLTVYDLTGREIAALYSGELDRGWHYIDWEAENLASGIYFVEMKAKNYYNTKKVILLR